MFPFWYFMAIHCAAKHDREGMDATSTHAPTDIRFITSSIHSCSLDNEFLKQLSSVLLLQTLTHHCAMVERQFLSLHEEPESANAGSKRRNQTPHCFMQCRPLLCVASPLGLRSRCSMTQSRTYIGEPPIFRNVLSSLESTPDSTQFVRLSTPSWEHHHHTHFYSTPNFCPASFSTPSCKVNDSQFKVSSVAHLFPFPKAMIAANYLVSKQRGSMCFDSRMKGSCKRDKMRRASRRWCLFHSQWQKLQ